MIALETRGLSQRYGGRQVLCDLDLAVRSGELLAVCGRNGAGKTTLVRILAGLVDEWTGQVILLDRPLRSWTRLALARTVAYVAQQTDVRFPFRVEEVVLMGRLPHQAPAALADGPRDHAIARACLARVGALPLAERDFGELSGGERQLVALASALAQQPRILVLDEPTASLDLRNRLRFGRLVQALRDEDGLTVVLVTHDLDLATAVCDRLVLLKAGRVASDLRPPGGRKLSLTPGLLADVFDLPYEDARTSWLCR